MVFFFFSCNEDNLSSSSKEDVITQLKKELKLNQFSNKNIAENLVINWNEVHKIEKEGLEIYEIKAVERNPVKIDSKFFHEKLKYELIVIKKNDSISSYLIEAFSGIKNDVFPESIQYLSNYVGSLNVYDLKGDIINQLVINGGKANNFSNNSSLFSLESAINLFYKTKSIASKIPYCDDSTQIVPCLVSTYLDNYTKVSYESGVVIGVYYVNSVLLESHWGTMSTPYPCGNNGDDFMVAYHTSGYRNVILDDLIAYDKLDPCNKEVMGQLMKGTTVEIADVLKKLNANFSKYNVNIVSKTLNSPSAAQTGYTDTNVKFNYTINIADDFVLGTKLFKAEVLLHEIVHAYFLSIIDDFSVNGSTTKVYDLNSLPSLFQAFCDKNYPPTNGVAENAHHEDMANLYVGAIASALQDYNKINDPNGLVPYQVYSDLAWVGLIGTPVYNKHFENKYDENLRIRNRYSSEISGRAVGAGTTNVQSPVGKPCN